MAQRKNGDFGGIWQKTAALENFHFHKEAVHAEGRHGENEDADQHVLHRMLVEVVVRLAVREPFTDDGAYEPGEKDEEQQEGHVV